MTRAAVAPYFDSLKTSMSCVAVKLCCDLLKLIDTAHATQKAIILLVNDKGAIHNHPRK